MVLIIRCNSISSDSRVEKYISFFKQNGIPYHILGWNRTDNNSTVANATFYNKKCGYSLGGLKAAYYRIGWMTFCLRFLLRNRNKFNVIHGCDLDSAFPAVIFKLLCPRRNVKVIFDVFDWFSATLYNQPKIVLKAFSFMESITTKYADAVIICEEERIQQIPYDIAGKKYVLPNIPYFSDNRDFLQRDNLFQFPSDKVTVSYVGGFYNGRLLDVLLKIAEMGEINLLIAGYGDHDLEEQCKHVSKLPNVYYAGKVEYTYGLKMMYNSDIIYAMYCTSNPNHIYAAPNKYYEAMFLAKPIITNKGTIVAEKVQRDGIGYVVDESIDDILRTIRELKPIELQTKGKIAFNLWNTKYKSYVQDFLSNEYSSFLSDS